MSLQNAENRIILRKQIHIAMNPDRVHRCRLIGEYGVRSVKDSTGLKQAFTVNEATMNHEDTINLSPVSTKKGTQ